MMLFVNDALHTDKAETSLQETLQSVEAQDFNEGEETEDLNENNFDVPSHTNPVTSPN
jgi:hypothetical protein